MNCTHYINLSGGVDSAYYLWRWVQENPDKKILIHHCLLYDKRRVVEKKATDQILTYLKDNGYKNFHYVETEFTRKGISGDLNDIVVIGFMSGLILKNARKFPSVKTVLLSYCYEETPKIRGLFEQNKTVRDLGIKNRTAIFINCLETVSMRTFDFVIPYVNKTKQEMIAEMPEELFTLSWFCRAPVNGQPCGVCFNCKRVLHPQTT